MDWRILTSTFVLIFLAELGDKTQLAALATAASSRSTVSVFLGATLALVVSTLIAVLLGDAFHRWVPVSTVKILAGCLFLLFGVLLLVSVWRAPAEEARAAPTRGPANLLVRAAIDAALAFEEDVFAVYEDLAATGADEATRSLCHRLAAEEREHLAHLRGLGDAHGHAPMGTAELPAGPAVPPVQSPDRVPPSEALTALLTHERRAAAFFHALARNATLGTLREAFAQLATEEEVHVQRLEALLSETP